MVHQSPTHLSPAANKGYPILEPPPPLVIAQSGSGYGRSKPPGPVATHAR
jgi:hypothetical protein